MAEGALNVIIGAKSNKLAGDLRKAKGEFTNFSKDAKKSINDTSKVFDSLGDAVGGVVGDITSTLTSLATAGGPIALIAAAIGLISKAWKIAKEDVDLYLKSASKVKIGEVGFAPEANDLRKNTRKIAQGAVIFDTNQMVKDFVRAGFLYNQIQKETDVNKKAILQTELNTVNAEYQSLKAQRAANIEILDSLRGRQAKIDLELKFQKLLSDEAKDVLADKALETKWIADQEEMIRIKTIILQKTKEGKNVEKETAEFAVIANTIQKEKLADIDDDIQRTTQLLTLQGKTGELEIFLLGKAQEKAEVEKQNATYMLKEELLLTKADAAATRRAKAEEKRLKTIKDEAEALEKVKKLNEDIADKMRESAQFSMPSSFANLGKNKSLIGGGMARGGGDLAGLNNGETSDQALERINATVTALEEEKTTLQIIGETASSTASAFSALGDAMASASADGKITFSEAMNVIMQAAMSTISILGALAAAGIIAKEASKGVVGIFTAIAGLAMLGGLWATFVKPKKYADGTNFAMGGLSLVGERGPELVNLPRGSQVFSNRQSSNMMGGQVLIKFQNGSLQGYMDYQNRKINSYA